MIKPSLTIERSVGRKARTFASSSITSMRIGRFVDVIEVRAACTVL